MAKAGEDHPNSKVTAKEVRYIRENPDGLNDYEMGAHLKIHRTTVRLIRLNIQWRDDDYEPAAPPPRGRPRKTKEHPASPNAVA